MQSVKNFDGSATAGQSRLRPKIVILGAGFGGMYTFLNIRKQLSASEADITIINKTNYFLFTPLLHEVATGGLAHHQVVESIRSIIYKRSATLHVAEVVKVHTQERVVETTVGRVPYDILVIATGASTAFYGIPGAAEKTLVLKSLHDAIAMRNRLIMAFEQAVETKDAAERKRLLTFVVAGGGATGVELAAEMTDLFFDTVRKFFCGKIECNEISIYLIAGDTELLKMFDPKVRNRAKTILTRKGVNIVFGKRVKSVDDDGVALDDGSRIDAETVLWLAGVGPNVPVTDVSLARDERSGRIFVDQNMRVVGQEQMYALGDVATVQNAPVPMLAQAAVQAAPIVARNVISEVWAMRKGKPVVSSRLRIFRFKSKGDLLSLGQWQAVGHVFNILWEGPIAWFIWRTVYLTKFASWPKRIKIAVDWTIDLFYPRDITKA
jgi:NADH dehydrogenase